MTADVILEQLRQGERTTSELCTAAAVSRNAVLLSLAGLNQDGYTIANVNAGGLKTSTDRLFDFTSGRGGHAEARWRLVHDPEHPRIRICSWPGCATPLNHYNPSTYCLYHRAGVARLLLACLDERLDDHEEVAADEQLSLA